MEQSSSIKPCHLFLRIQQRANLSGRWYFGAVFELYAQIGSLITVEDFAIGAHVCANREILDGYQRPYLGIQFEHGSEIPSPAQVRALLYAQEQMTWFDRGRLFHQMTVLICTERGWLAERDGQLRITSEGKRVLRCVRLDQEERLRRNREQHRRGTSVSDVPDGDR